ncbi:MAG: hypothetical protein M1831_004992 [Alyxoria varia]|nr:MAG: hypothetical protein M1831_004992 [Alyxoria varia]
MSSDPNFLKLTSDDAPQYPAPRPLPNTARSNSEPITSSPLADARLTRTATTPGRKKREHSEDESDIQQHHEQSPSSSPPPATGTAAPVPDVEASAITHAKAGEPAPIEKQHKSVEQFNPAFASSGVDVSPSTQTEATTPLSESPLQPTPTPQYPGFEPDAISEHPFSHPLPRKTHPHHRRPLRSEQTYALYTLAPLHGGNMVELLNHIAIIGASEDPDNHVTTVVPAPVRHDFSGDTLRAIFEYHVELLELSQRHKYDEMHFSHDIAGKRFLVAASEDWEGNGLLLVEFDCDGEGSLGILRVRADQVIAVCVSFERGSAALDWEDMKEVEMFEPWKGPIPGYSGSEWERHGVEKAHKW